mgnify:CR=1 FL=1
MFGFYSLTSLKYTNYRKQSLNNHFGILSAFWALSFLVPFTLIKGMELMIEELFHVLLLEYFPFLILLLSLFAISGGIRIKGKLSGNPI